MLFIAREHLVSKIINSKKDYSLGFLIHLISYFTALLAKRGNIVLEESDLLLLIIFLITSFAVTLILEKYHNQMNGLSVSSSFKTYFYSFLISIGAISTIITLFFKEDPSRYIVFGAIIISFVLETIILLFKKNFQIETNLQFNFEFSFKNFLFELFIFILTAILFLVLSINKMPSFTIYPFIYLSLFLSWLISSLLIHQFTGIKKATRFWIFIWKRMKTYILFVFVVSLLFYAFNVDHHLRQELIIFSIIYSFLAIISFTIFFIIMRQPKTDEIKGSIRAITEYKENINFVAQEFSEKYISPLNDRDNLILGEQLANVYLNKFPGVYDFLNTTINLSSFDLRRCIIIRSADTYNVEILPENFIEFYLNLHEINDIGKINDYFLKINKRLLTGGFYIGRVEPTHLRFERFLSTYPYHIARLFYFFDFLWKRAVPNLPFLRKIYFAFTKGKKRAISFPEALGRLYYCGFEICNYQPFGNFIYFICKKIEQPDSTKNLLYGPLIKLKRVGQYGKIINIYKFRTMHPYSEYIQKFIYEKNNLAQGGKIRNDFRITSWGKILRKLWLDEFPMFLNLLKGNLKLIGVRPLSQHYFSLYEKELQELRVKFKPGIFPPFYYDLPKTFDEIMNSERRYLELYEKHPFITDFKYFFVILYNILIKKARSL